jgi:hypothetical protein
LKGVLFSAVTFLVLLYHFIAAFDGKVVVS